MRQWGLTWLGCYRRAGVALSAEAAKNRRRRRRDRHAGTFLTWIPLLALRPNDAWAHYGRGIARLRTGNGAEGEADVAAAKAQSPSTVARFEGHGIIP